MENPVRSRIRRGAHTPRGQQTRAAILKAARQMCSQQWLDQLSLAELAREAGTTRASVLFQFQEGWPDIAAELMIEELKLPERRPRRSPGNDSGPPRPCAVHCDIFCSAANHSARCLRTCVPSAISGATRSTRWSRRRATPSSAASRGSCRRWRPAASPRPRPATPPKCWFTSPSTWSPPPCSSRLDPVERAARLDTAVNLVIHGLTRKP